MAQISLNCKKCNKTFSVYPYRIKTALFCSINCRIQSKKGSLTLKKCLRCNKEFTIYLCPSTIGRKRGKFCSKKCWYLFKVEKGILRGENSPSWKGGRAMHQYGYILLKTPNHPHAINNGYVREHRLVIEKKLGRYLLPTEDIHHINGIKTDNRIENLELFLNRSEHLKKEHQKGIYKEHLKKLILERSKVSQKFI